MTETLITLAYIEVTAVEYINTMLILFVFAFRGSKCHTGDRN